MSVLEKIYELHDEVVRLERKHGIQHGGVTCVSDQSIGGVVTFQLTIKVSPKFMMQLMTCKDHSVIGGLDVREKPFKFHGIPLYVAAQQKEDFKVVTR